MSSLVVLGSLLIFFLTLFIYKNYLRFSTGLDTSLGISSLEQIELGGLKQWIFIRGEDQNNPILLFLHGGPGEPVMAMSGSRKFDSELIKHFTMVHWDQRGAGKTYSPNIPVESMTLDRLVEDCSELIDYLREKLDKKKVFVVGHSGGTIIGLRIAKAYPEKLYAYVGVAQIVNDFEQHRIMYDFLLERTTSRCKLHQVHRQVAFALPRSQDKLQGSAEGSQKSSLVCPYTFAGCESGRR